MMAQAENVEGANFKWRTPVKLVLLASLILDSIVLLALAIGITAKFYPPPATSSWALVAVPPFQSLSYDDWCGLGAFATIKTGLDLIMLMITSRRPPLKKHIVIYGLSAAWHICSVTATLQSQIGLLAHDHPPEKMEYVRDHQTMNLIIIVYHGFCLYPMWMFLKELAAAERRSRFQTEGTDPPSPEEMRSLSIKTRSGAEEDSGSEMSEDEKWERSVIDFYS